MFPYLTKIYGHHFPNCSPAELIFHGRTPRSMQFFLPDRSCPVVQILKNMVVICSFIGSKRCQFSVRK